MSQIELIETFDPQPEAMVRSFHCAVCDKQHLQTGTLARVWVLFQEGYATQASLACLNAAQPRVQLTNGGRAKIKGGSNAAIRN